MPIVLLREVCNAQGQVVNVRIEEVGPDMEDVKLYPVEVRTVPERNYARAVSSAFLASGARVDAASFEAAAEALEREAAVPTTTLIIAAFAPIIQEAERTVALLGKEWQKAAERAYLQQHRRLPGSLRTSRLRKKRRTKVLAWFGQYLEGVHNGEE